MYDRAYGRGLVPAMVSPYYRPLVVGAAASIAGLGLPPLGYIDRSWTPAEINSHILYLEQIYATTVAQGYRVIYNPLTGALQWVLNPAIPDPNAPLPGAAVVV